MQSGRSPFSSHFYVSDLVHLARRYWLPLFLVPAVCLSLIAVYAVFGTKFYSATAAVYMDPSFGQRMQTESIAKPPQTTEDEGALYSMEETICSGPMVLRVLKSLGLERDIDYLPPSIVARMEKGLPVSDSRLIDAVKSRYEAELVNATRILKVHATDTSPERAALIAEVFITEFVSFLQEQRVESETALKKILLEQSETIRERAVSAEKELNEFRKRQSDFLVEQDSDLFAQQMAGVATELSTTNAQLIRQKSLLDALTLIDARENPIRVFSLTKDEHPISLEGLIKQHSDAQVAIEEVKHRYPENHPEYVAAHDRFERINESLREHAAEIKEWASLRFEQLTDQKNTLEAEMVRLRQDFNEYKLAGAEFRGLTGAVDREWDAYARINSRILNLTENADLSPNLATALGDPIVPFKISRKKLISAAAVGMVVSVGWIVVVAAFLIFRGLPFTSTRQLQDILDVPLIGTIKNGNEIGSGSLSCLPFLATSRRIVYLTAINHQQESSKIRTMVTDSFLNKGKKLTVFRVTDNSFEGSHQFDDARVETVMVSTSQTDFVALKENIERFLEAHPQQNVLIDTTNVTDSETKLALGRIAESALVIVDENGDSREKVERWFRRLKEQMTEVLAVYQSRRNRQTEMDLALPIDSMVNLARPSHS